MNQRLALLDLRAEAGQWVLIPVVFALATVLIILPTNLHTTFQSSRFVTYMGAAESDLRADLQFSDDVDATHRRMALPHGGRRSVHRRTRLRKPSLRDSRRGGVGDRAGRGGRLFRWHGRVPRGRGAGEGEIALSVMNADQYSLSPGDEMSIRRSGDSTDTVMVSGIYQDVTSGGYTATMQGDVGAGAVGYGVYADAAGDVDPATLAREYSDTYPSATVIPMQE